MWLTKPLHFMIYNLYGLQHLWFELQQLTYGKALVIAA